MEIGNRKIDPTITNLLPLIHNCIFDHFTQLNSCKALVGLLALPLDSATGAYLIDIQQRRAVGEPPGVQLGLLVGLAHAEVLFGGLADVVLISIATTTRPSGVTVIERGVGVLAQARHTGGVVGRRRETVQEIVGGVEAVIQVDSICAQVLIML